MHRSSARRSAPRLDRATRPRVGFAVDGLDDRGRASSRPTRVQREFIDRATRVLLTDDESNRIAMSRDAMNDDAPIADVGTTRRNAAKTIEEAMASSTIARLAWSGWTHVTRRRRETNARATALWRDRSRRTSARTLIAWARITKFNAKRREMTLERSRAQREHAKKLRTLREWKASVRRTREARRDVIHKYLVWRAKKFLRHWRQATEESVEARGGRKRAVEPAAAAEPSAAPTKAAAVRRRERHATVSVGDMKSRLWTKADPAAVPMPVSHVVEEIEAAVMVERTTSGTSTTSTTTTSAPQTQRAQVRRRKVVVRESGENEAEETVVVTKKSADAKKMTKTKTTKLVDATTMTPVASAVSQPSPRTSSSSSQHMSTIIIVVVLLAIFGAIALASILTGVSPSFVGAGATSVVRQHLSEAQRNVTILARASAMQRRELEACRTFGGGVPDASQNAAIASAEAKVSDSVVQVADLEVKLTKAKADVAAAQSAQKLAEDRFNRLGSSAMTVAQLQESLQKMTTRATYCESTSVQALKLKAAKDIATARAESAEKDAADTKSKLTKTKTHLLAAQRSLTQTVDVANECRYQIGKPAYVPSYHSNSSLLRVIADMFPAFSWFFSSSALLFYVVCSYAYYLRAMVASLVGERDTLVGELAKIRTRGVAPNRPHLEHTRVMHEHSAESSGADDDSPSVGKTSSFDRKRSRSVSDIGKDGAETSQKKTATASDVKDNDEENESAATGVEEVTSAEDLSKEQTERAHKLIERWAEKSADDEITGELDRIRRLVELEDERERLEEESQLERLKRQIELSANDTPWL